MIKNRGVDHRILQYYGIAQNPETKEYLMVIEYATHGSLHNFLSNLSNSGKELLWKRKIDLLYNISSGLESVHLA
ncbi:296_t:CDS:1, partial [Diversispora eburnea]